IDWAERINRHGGPMGGRTGKGHLRFRLHSPFCVQIRRVLRGAGLLAVREQKRAERKMTAQACRRGHGPGLVVVLASAIPAAALPGLPSAQAAEAVAAAPLSGTVVVAIDRAKVVKLPDRTTTLVIGNPLIADAAVQAGGIAVITAKSYGATNL